MTFIIKKHYLLAHYIVSFRTSALDCDAHRSPLEDLSASQSNVTSK